MDYEKFMTKTGLDKKVHQKEAIEWCLEREKGQKIYGKVIKGGLIADEMGLGKTIEILGTIVINFKRRTLIVVPRALLEQWRMVFSRIMGHEPLVYHGNEKKDLTIEDIKKSPIVITTYGMISTLKNPENPDEGIPQLLHGIKWSRVVFDEAHHLRNKKTNVHLGALALKTEIMWLMTGTPIQNRKEDLYSLFTVIGIPREHYIVSANIIELRHQVILRRTKEDAGIKLPNMNTNIINVDWETEKERELAEDIHHMLAFSDVKPSANSCAGLFSEHILVAMIRSRQMCVFPDLIKKQLDEAEIPDSERVAIMDAVNGKSKINKVVQTIVENKSNGKAKLVFCHYRGEIDIIKHQLKLNGMVVESFDGRVKNSERQEILTRKDLDVLILQIQTGCEGLNLQHFSEIYFVSPHWNPAVEDQAVARCHRIGQADSVNVYRFKMNSFDGGNKTTNIDRYSTQVQERKRIVQDEILQ